MIGNDMLRIRIIAFLATIVLMFASFSTLALANETNTTWQIITHVDEVLKENPLPPGKVKPISSGTPGRKCVDLPRSLPAGYEIV